MIFYGSWAGTGVLIYSFFLIGIYFRWTTRVYAWLLCSIYFFLIKEGHRFFGFFILRRTRGADALRRNKNKIWKHKSKEH